MKLATGTTLVKKTLDLVSSSGLKDPRLEELQNGLKSLKLEDLDVDLTSTQISFHEEITLLRSAVNQGIATIEAGGELKSPTLTSLPPPPVPPATNVNTATTVEVKEVVKEVIKDDPKTLEKIKALESDNENLRKLLKDAQAELAAAIKTSGDLEKKLEAGTKASASAATDATKSLEAELAKATKEIADLNNKLEQVKKEGEDRLAAKVAELTKLADERVSEIETRLETEKDVMMEAMAQEVDAIEKQKDAEKDAVEAQKNALEAEKNALIAENAKTKALADAEIQKMSSKLADALKSNSLNAERILSLHQMVSAVSKAAKNNATVTKGELADMKYALKNTLGNTIMAKLKAKDDEIVTLVGKYRKEMTERKKLHNMIQELKGNIRVFMRCRPPTTKEIEQFGNDAQCVTCGDGEVKVFNEKNREKIWEFDETFGTDSTQEQVYSEVSALVTSVMDGYNVCIFAYGQTGSGKTHTMSGPESDRGVNTRALGELFDKCRARRGEWKDTITVSLLEVYNEEIRDLLTETSEKLDVRQGEFGNYVPGLTQVPVENLQNVFDLLAVADRNRSSATTNMNEHSSRSHMMLTCVIVSENPKAGITTRGRLNLVDLAGSERINKSGATGQALKEAQNINKSLSALGDVIAARASGQAHIPFRNSTLTYLLQDSLSKDSKTLMIVCVSPVLYNSEETFCSLNFAARVRTVELGKASKQVIDGSASGASAGSKAGGAPSGLTRTASSSVAKKK